MSTDSFAALLAAQRDRVVERFVNAMSREGEQANAPTRAHLVDHVPMFLDGVVRALAPAGSGTGGETVRVAAREHGESRWTLGYDLEGLVREYGVLEHSVLELAQESDFALTPREYEVLAHCFNRGIALAAAEYVKHRDLEARARSDQRSLLFDAGEALVSSLELRASLRKLARVLVPRFADWCAIQVDHLAEPLVVVHGSPNDAEQLAELYRQMRAGEKDWGFPFLAGLGDVVVGQGPPQDGALAADPERRALLSALRPHSWMVVPLKLRHAAIGSLTVVYNKGDRRYADAERSFANELARHAAVAIENAQLYRRSQEERERVERALRSKDEFVAIISHELRTPLNSVLGWLTLMRTSTLPPDRLNHALDVVERNAKAQARIVDDLLDISKLVTGNIRISPAQLDLSNLVDMVIESLRPAAEAKRILIRRDVEGDDAVQRGDSQRLQQVVWQLLMNAIKFTPKDGHISIKLGRKRSSLELLVEDDGEGIAAELLPRIFEPFFQSDSSFSRRHGGLGLGLAIAKHLVELHGGSIDAFSGGVGRGATFRVLLPVSPAISSALGIPRMPLPRAGGEAPVLPVALLSRRILIVDDDPDARDLIATILTTAGAETQTAASAKEATEVLATFEPHAIVTDVGMPEDDGFALLRGVRDRPGQTPPVIALSGRVGDDHRSRAIAAGFSAYETKPVESSALVTIIADLVRAAEDRLDQ